MTATLTQIRAGLQTRLHTIAAFDDSQVWVTRPTTVVTPAAIIEPAEGVFYEYDTSSDSHDLHLSVLVLVSRADDATGWSQLDPFVDPTGVSSIAAAVDGDDSLGGLVDDADVITAGDYGDYDFGGVAYFGCRFAVTVLLRS